MRAVLLAAGLGTRLRPLTDHTPKCLVEIAGRPLLDYWLHDLSQSGVDEFLVNTHYLPDQVRHFLAQHPLHARISVTHEETLLGTAGTLLKNREFVSEGTTLVAHADNFCLCPWSEFFSAHESRPQECLMTMMTFETADPTHCGIVETDSRGIVQAFHEKVPNPPGNMANAAVYLIEPEVVRLMADASGPVHDLSTQVLPSLLGRIHVWHNRHILIDIGSPERLATAQAAAMHLP